MTFQNSRYTGKSKIWRISWLLIVTTLSTMIIISETVTQEFGKRVEVPIAYKIIGILAILITYGIITLIRYQKKYNFIFFTDEDKQNLIFRFYHIKVFGKKYTTYKIPIPDFLKFEIVNDGKKHELYLFQKIKNKAAKYPPISITALSENEVATLTNALQTYTK